jgi:dienelactone hydrolase
MESIAKFLAWTFILACALASLGCEGGPLTDCYYDVPPAVYAEGPRESARIYYPCNIVSLRPVAATTLANGNGGNKEGVLWLAERLARAQIVVCAVSAMENTTLDGYATAHKSALGILKSENADAQCLLYNKMAAFGIMGYSKGGGGAINAAAELGSQIETCVALSPWMPTPARALTAATLILTCEQDDIAPPVMGSLAYQALAGRTPKAYASMAGVGHAFWLYNSAPGSSVGYIAAWLKYWQEGKRSYAATLENPEADMLDVRMQAWPLALVQ